jgi:hypothetical protein
MSKNTQLFALALSFTGMITIALLIGCGDSNVGSSGNLKVAIVTPTNVSDDKKTVTNTHSAQLSTSITQPTGTSLAIPVSSTAQFTTKTPSNTSSYSSTDWLKGVSCQLPCIFGITPGQTTLETALKTLRENSYIDTTTITATESVALPKFGSGWWKWKNGRPAGKLSFDVTAQHKTILSVDIYAYGIFKLSDITRVYGEPEYVVADFIPDGAGSYGLAFYWFNHSFIFRVGSQPTPYKITPDMLISSKSAEDNIDTLAIASFAPTTLAEHIDVMGEKPAIYVKWQGYKDYMYYCRYYRTGEMCK